jgi:hypothetical protein
MVKVCDRRHIPMAHQHLSQIINTVVRVDRDGRFAAGVDGRLVVYPMADVIQTV